MIRKFETRWKEADFLPIKIPKGLPAEDILHRENIFTILEERAGAQDIRPLRILLLNLMPTKIATETQLARLLGNTPLQIDLELMMVGSHIPRNTPRDHMIAFYKNFDEVRDYYYDGMVITGAPVELLDFEQVDYWEELCEIMEWSTSHVYSTFHICWAAQAALYYHYGIPKYTLDEKLVGIFDHQVTHEGSILFRGFDDVFRVPHSRNTTIHREDIVRIPRLKILAESDEAGVYAVSTHGGRQIFITGHSEYDVDTIDKEYRRDVNNGINPKIPKHYYPDDDPSKEPMNTWRSGANLLYSNWLDYFVYQETPYIVEEVGNIGEIG